MQQDEQKDKLSQSLEEVHARKESFSELPPYQKPKLMQRIGKKRTYWYVQPFGEAQNAYNAAAAEALTALTKQVQRLQSRLNALTEQNAQELSAIRQEQRQAMNRAQEERAEAMRQLSAELDGSMADAAPESRNGVGRAPLTALSPIGTEALFREYHAVQQAEGQAQTDSALQALADRYAQQLHEQLEKTRTANRRIAVICRRNGDAESRREAEALFLLLQRASRYPVCLLYVDPAGGKTAQAGDAACVPENRLHDWVNAWEPALLVICEPTPELLTAGNQCLLLRNAVIRLSGQNPVQGLGGSKMQELLHLNDCGLHQYCTASRRAADVLEAHGFRRPRVMYPLADLSRPALCRSPRIFDPARFTVGADAEPIPDADGLRMLCETVRQNPDMRFVVLWQNADAVPAELQAAENCEFRTGEYDRNAFYGEIDCMLILSSDHASACPRTALEAMLLGIPAAAVPESGIAELIAECGLGIAAKNSDSAEMCRVLREIRAQYAAFGAVWRQEKLRALTDGRHFVRDTEKQLADALPQPVHTLFEWDRQLKLKSQHLLRGQAALRAYYQRRSEPDEAAVYPQNCFDLMECGSVGGLLRHLCGSRNDLRMLDLMSGTGRILRELLPFGSCTAYDPSSVMMNRLREQFPSGVTLHEADPFSGGITGQYDVITVFRYLRHCEYAVRKKLWAQLRDALTKDGMLLFDVPNRRFELPHRAKNGWDQTTVYDIFWTKDSIAEELAANGLHLKALIPVGQGLYPLPAEYRGEPMTWTACAVK